MKDFINSLGKDGLKSAYSLIESFALYLTIAIAVILFIAYIVMKLRASEKLATFKTLALGVAIGYAITLCSIIGFLMIAKISFG